MKVLIGLTLLQVLIVEAIPHQRRRACSPSAPIETHFTTVTLPVATYTVASQQTAAASENYGTTTTIHITRTTTVFPEQISEAPSSIPPQTGVVGPVDKSSDGVIFISYSAPESSTSLPVTVTKNCSSTESSLPAIASVTSVSSYITSTATTETGTPAASSSSASSQSPASSSVSTSSGGIFFQSVSTSTVTRSASVSTTSSSLVLYRSFQVSALELPVQAAVSLGASVYLANSPVDL